jgi:hypothetical protein
MNNSLAFPQWSEAREPGMTLRDYFAAHALQGLLAADREFPGQDGGKAASRAYVFADAMLKVREAQQ